MFDFTFNWFKELETGDEIIDQQHREIFRIGRDIEQLIAKGCIGVQDKELLNIVCELRDYISYHFYSEEDIMRKHGYSDYENHVKEHLKFKEDIVKIDCRALGENPSQELKKIKEIMQSWVFTHILAEDAKITKGGDKRS